MQARVTGPPKYKTNDKAASALRDGSASTIRGRIESAGESCLRISDASDLRYIMDAVERFLVSFITSSSIKP
jgi:hypothetical protein